MCELLLARHANSLLSQYQLKRLIQFSQFVEHDLKPWLIREKRRSASVNPQDFETALAILHTQFTIPYPQSLPLSQEREHLDSSPATPSERTDGWNDLKWLFQQMASAQCVEWALLLATVLLKISSILILLKENFHLWKPYKRMLQSQTK